MFSLNMCCGFNVDIFNKCLDKGTFFLMLANWLLLAILPVAQIHITKVLCNVIYFSCTDKSYK